jgi:hypothetical protein
MKKTLIVSVVVCTVLLLGAVGYAMKVSEENLLISPISQIQADVVTYDLDPARVTCDWPKTVTVTNTSDKQISGFDVDIWAANDEGGPLRSLSWGTNPNFRKQTQLFNPGEKITLSIDEKIVQTFEENGNTFLYVQADHIWVNNDPEYLYSDGAIFQQDSSNPGHYTAIRDAKGRVKLPSGKWSPVKHDHNHALTPHITHSIKPPFPLGCCTRNVAGYNTVYCLGHELYCPPHRACYVLDLEVNS